jgi:hypothetical protein
MRIQVRVDTQNHFVLFHAYIRRSGRIANPIAGPGAHGAGQSPYQVTDAEPGNAGGTPEPDRQVNPKAVRPVPARVRSGRRSGPS